LRSDERSSVPDAAAFVRAGLVLAGPGRDALEPVRDALELVRDALALVRDEVTIRRAGRGGP